MKKYEAKNARLSLAKEIATEGIVMLKNEKQLLPLAKGAEVAVFGCTQLQPIIGGGGSGASYSKETTIILEELKRVGLQPVEALESFYREHVERLSAEAKKQSDSQVGFEELVNSGLIYEIFGRYHAPEQEFGLPPSLVEEIPQEVTAICILGRSSGGEECDRRVEEDYYLTQSEQQMIKGIAAHFTKIILVLNTNGFIDLSWMNDYPGIQSVLYLGTAGEQGAAALAELIIGEATPSGRLSATMAHTFWDYPSSPYFFTNKDQPDTMITYEKLNLSAKENGSYGFDKSPVAFYHEGIYVGYRYFDTFRKEVLFPFGFGLSYAEFGMEYLSSALLYEVLKLKVKVKNYSTRYSGKEVAQLYVSANGTVSERPYQELLTYEKTKTLAPGEEEVLVLSVPITELAIYQEKTASYVIEAGEYYLRLGNSSRATQIIGKITVPEAIVTARLHNRLTLNPANHGKLEFLRAPIQEEQQEFYAGEGKEKELAPCLCRFTLDCLEKQHEGEAERKERKNVLTKEQIKGQAAVPLSTSVEKSSSKPVIRLCDVKSGKYSMEAFVEQFTIKELAVLVNGYGPGLPFGGMGGKYPATINNDDGEPIATGTHPVGAAGYVSPAMERYGIPSVFYKDGPASVGMTAWPTGMSMACTFNKQALYEFGHACATEAKLQLVDSWLAPGINLQRSPIGGRNFEYYSEDPRHTGYCGLAIAKGAEDNSTITTCPKHFALNEQETYRRGNTKKSIDALDSIIEERAAREIYLKPFEMLVRGSRVATIMTSFNKINGCFAAGNQDLCKGILREEWGYDGIVVTDWGDMDIVVDGADAVAAGNDIIMPGGPPVIKQVLKGYEEGRCSLEDLRKAASNLLSFVMKTTSYDQYYNK